MGDATPLPAGTVTFLFTDIEGSTRLLQHLGDRYPALLADHHRLLRAAFQHHGGHEIGTEGDSFFIVFPSAAAAVAAALAAQQAVATHPWPGDAPVRVRMGLHTGEPILTPEGYVGLDVHRAARISAAAHGGQILLSEATRAAAAEELPSGARVEDLGLHRLKDLQRPEQLFLLLHPDLLHDFPPIRSLEAYRHNLPVQLTSFVGREREMAEVKQILTTTHLLTLTGAGGCGKTRLALQVAAEAVEEFADGVWLVELAALLDAALVPQAVARVLGVREEPGRLLADTLCDYLHSRSLLLVLDNCEHLVSACAELVERLLRACPHLRILATSREILAIPGETTWRVRSLAFPDLARLPQVEAERVTAVTRCEAARLFIERASAVTPGFAVTGRTAPALAQVCLQLDGIPLAIELAAARVKVLSIEQVAARLDDRFRLLTGGSRTALPRQQTLRATIDWSYDLLSEAERVLLRRLSVFAGGCTLEAAEAVCGDGVDSWQLTVGSGDASPAAASPVDVRLPTANCQLSTDAVLDLLSRLTDKSLVIAEEFRGTVRYRLLETIRQYAQERLLQAGEVARLSSRHHDWYLALAETAEPHLTGPGQAHWLNRLEDEHDNLRAALQWSERQLTVDSGQLTEGDDGQPALLSTDHCQLSTALRLAGALWRFWMVRGYIREGQGWLERGLAECGDVPAGVRAKACTGAGSMAWLQGEIARAAAFHEQSLALYQEAGDMRGAAFALKCMSTQAGLLGDYERARALEEESLALYRALGDRWGIACALCGLGCQAGYQGNNAQAMALFEESLALWRELGDTLQTAIVLQNLGEVARYQGEYGQAASFLEEGLSLSRDIGAQTNAANALICLGLLRQELGDPDQASTLLREALTLCQELGDRRAIAESLEGLAGAAGARNQPERAARLFGAAEALREALHAPLPPSSRALYDRDVAAARAGLDAEAFAAAWAEGHAKTLDEIIAYALVERRGRLNHA
jgi:predicted ATPase/class 3 adenylate cyclase